MQKLAAVGLLAMAMGISGVGLADVLTFGPVESSDSAVMMPSNYGGFSWDPNWAVTGNPYFESYGNTYGAPSGGAAFNSAGVVTVTTSSSSPFTFNGAEFTGWAQDDTDQTSTSTTITVNGYDASNSLIGSVSMDLSPSAYEFLSADFLNVSSLEFVSSGVGQWFLMDDFTYNDPIAAPTPEPSCWARRSAR